MTRPAPGHGPALGPRRHRGVALLIALALLAALTLTALTVAQTTTLELGMARNEEDALRALHAANAALSAAQAWLRDNASNPSAQFTATGAGGLHTAPRYGAQGPPPGAWRGDGSRAIPKPAGLRGTAPRYVIEWLGTHTDTGTAADPLPAAEVDRYRITARGFGNTFATADVRSTYAQTRDGRTERPLTGRLSWTYLDGA